MDHALRTALAFMRDNPQELEKKPTGMMTFLTSYLNSDGQGSANEVKPHEACIALVLETHGFVCAPRGVYPSKDGLYYWYQIQGSQRAGDFLVFEINHGVKTTERILDAKHSNGLSIYLNDGTFEAGSIYIVSFTRCLDRIKGQRKKPRENVCFIGFGETVMTTKDRETLTKWRAALRAMNDVANETDHLRLYARSANQYDCKRFTPEFTAESWEKLLSSFAPSSEQTVREQHSQSV